MSALTYGGRSEVKIWADVSVKKFSPNCLSPVDLDMVMDTVIENVFGTCRPKTGTTVPMAKKAHKEQGAACTFDGDDKKFGRTVDGDNRKGLHVHYKLYIMKVNRRHNIPPLFFGKTSGRSICIENTSIR